MRTAEDEMLDYEPASDEESGSEATGGQGRHFTSAEVNDLLKPEAESDSLGSTRPKYQPPFPVAEGTSKAAKPPATPEAAHVTSLLHIKYPKEKNYYLSLKSCCIELSLFYFLINSSKFSIAHNSLWRCGIAKFIFCKKPKS